MTRSILSLLLLSSALASAGSPAAVRTSSADSTLTTQTESGWEFTLGLYGWAGGLDGDIGAAGYVAPVDLSFSDIFDSLEMTASGVVEFRKDRFLFQIEGIYLRNGVDTSFTDENGIDYDADVVAETTRLEAVLGYRLLDTGCTTLDILGGAVYYNIENKLDLHYTGITDQYRSKGDWVDPIFGLRLNQRLGERWSLMARGEAGGGASADLTWQASALIGFDLTEGSTLYAGYRRADVDYQSGDFIYDTSVSGPILGITFTW